MSFPNLKKTLRLWYWHTDLQHFMSQKTSNQIVAKHFPNILNLFRMCKSNIASLKRSTLQRRRLYFASLSLLSSLGTETFRESAQCLLKADQYGSNRTRAPRIKCTVSWICPGHRSSSFWISCIRTTAPDTDTGITKISYACLMLWSARH